MTLLALCSNNAFGTPLTVTPQVVYQMGMDGRSPFPAGFWREGQGYVAMSMNVEYLEVVRTLRIVTTLAMHTVPTILTGTQCP